MSEVVQDPRDPQQRIEKILDDSSFHALTERDESGMLAGFGTISGTRVTLFATDATIQGGAMGEAGAQVILAAYADAMEHKNPIVGIWHSGGARLREGVKSLHAFGLVFNAITQASGKIPQFSLVLGPAAGGGAYGPALTDVIVLAPEGRIFVTGPDVVRSVTGESVDMARLGGPEPHGRRSGVVHVIAESEEGSCESIRQLVRLLGNQGSIDSGAADINLAQFLPESNKRAYDVHPLVAGMLDSSGDVQELHPKWAPNIVTTLGRLSGRTVGVVANNPLRLGGCLDSASAEKAARFVRMCDSFGVPLIVIVDVPGYLPGVGQEWDGVVRRGAKLLHAFSEAVVPRVTLITRKA
ncbi:MAG: carboxyl transferase domain-containing protein, partial [Actinomycetota bacterium]